MSYFKYYYGDGRESSSSQQIPRIDTDAMKNPAGYKAGEGLVAAVNVAIRLGMPLLLTGEPGIGKSQLAYSLAAERGLGEPLRFVVKSNTEGRDLFYQFDSVGRFHAASTKDDIDPRRFLQFNALGKAILYTHSLQDLEAEFGAASLNLDYPKNGPCQSVVLIDEIDKAPRDVPNDLLWEVEEKQFNIAEIASHRRHLITPNADLENSSALKKFGFVFGVNEQRRELAPIVIITSNSERALPNAFLRRCVYYHIPFPSFDKKGSAITSEVTVQDIVASRLGARYKDHYNALVNDAISFFRFLRGERLDRNPGLAEFLNWLDFLLPLQLSSSAPLGRLTDLSESYRLNSIRSILLKSPSDQKSAAELFNVWLKSAPG